MRETIAAVVLAMLVPARGLGAPVGWSTVMLPMERSAFAAVVGLEPTLPRALLLPQAIRKLHDDDLKGGGLRARVAAALAVPSTGGTAVPLPLAAATGGRERRRDCRP